MNKMNQYLGGICLINTLVETGKQDNPSRFFKKKKNVVKQKLFITVEVSG